jgi:hypothetical protein
VVALACSLARIFAQRKLTFSSHLIPYASNPARQAPKPAQKTKMSKEQRPGYLKTAPKQEKKANDVRGGRLKINQQAK